MIASDVAGGLAEAGIDGQIVRPGQGIQTDLGYAPGPDEVIADVSVVFTRISAQDQTNFSIQVGDRMVLVSALGGEPTPDDKLRVDGVDWRIVEVMQVAPANEAVLYKCQVRL